MEAILRQVRRTMGHVRPTGNPGDAKGKKIGKATTKSRKPFGLIQSNKLPEEDVGCPVNSETKTNDVAKPPRRGTKPARSDAVSLFVSDIRPDGVPDIDTKDSYIITCPDYARDIVNYCKSLELRFALKSNYLEKCSISEDSRAILLKWLVEVQDYLGLGQQTLHLAVAIVDHVLSSKVLSLAKLQLLGITAVLLATKFEERFAPEMQLLVQMTGDTYTVREVVHMELFILKALKYTLCLPTPMLFMNRALAAVGDDPKVRKLAKYIIDLGLTAFGLLKDAPSLRAAAVVFLAQTIRESESDAAFEGAWIRSLCHHLGYGQHQVRACADRYTTVLAKSHTPAKLQAEQPKNSLARRIARYLIHSRETRC